MKRITILASLLLLACTTPSGEGTPLPSRDASQGPRRWLKPSSNEVRAYPPHAIRPDGIGPYVLGQSLSDVLHSLPEGPRVELLQIGSVANWRVVRAEAGQLLLLADAENHVAAAVVLAPEIARTETGLGVGATGAELRKTLGPERELGDLSYDRRVFEFASLPGVSFVTDAASGAPAETARVIAVVLGWRQNAPSVPPQPLPADRAAWRAACRAGGALADARAEILAAARGRTSPRPTEGPVRTEPVVRFGCVTGLSPEAIVAMPGELVRVGGERGRLRRLGVLALDPFELASVLDLDDDGRDEIVVDAQQRSSLLRAVEVTVLRWENGRLGAVASARPFAVTAAEAAAVGVTPGDIDLALAFDRQDGGLGIGGLYLARKGGQGGSGPLVEVAPLVSTVLRMRGRHAPLGAAAGSEGSGWDAGPVKGMMRPTDGGISAPTRP
jgi:hypothetical protein